MKGPGARHPISGTIDGGGSDDGMLDGSGQDGDTLEGSGPLRQRRIEVVMAMPSCVK